jgi:hypothetical protein
MSSKNIYLVNLDTTPNERLQIQTVPDSINIDPISNWATIPVVGRNNPFYHYTGGEDEVRFTLDWYAETENQKEVIEACRWVESLSRNDGYEGKAPRVLLVFGELYRFSTWIVAKAPYELKFFQQGNGFLPIQAYQSLVLKKVSDINTSRAEIRSNQ